MKAVRFTLRLRFVEEIRMDSFSYQISRALGGKSPEAERIMDRGVRLEFDKDKIAVVWAPTGCQIALENISDTKHCIDGIISVLETINGVARIGKLRDRRLLTYWILPTPQYDFVSLERKYREIMITQNDISNSAYDSSAIFDIKRDRWILHHQSGAMVRKQLQQGYLNFELDNVPETFIFLEAGLTDDNVIQYSRGETYSFMERSLENCISHMEKFNRFCEGRL